MPVIDRMFGTFSNKELKRIKPILEEVLSNENEVSKLSDEQLKAKTIEFKNRLSKGETLDDILPEAFAVCREADWRVLGMKPYPVQILGGIVLHRACIAEMQTGEGKTLVATLPTYLNALTGKGVHVITVNDYLAKRDSEITGKVYRYLGLSVGLITHDAINEDRKKAYAADITYGTNNELGFDYLRDNMCMKAEDIVQRGHEYAIVDEIDSILIDEARTPLIISSNGTSATDMYTNADAFAKSLKKSVVVELDDEQDIELQVDGDYVVDEKHKVCTLTENGIKKAEAWFNVENLSDLCNMELRHFISCAIRANGIMQLDKDYIIKDGKVVIVDEFTGRVMEGRRYSEGLHQAIEAKEQVEIAAEGHTLASITFQNYFRMYKKLSGMTGTASTEADEFEEIYNLQIVTIPTNKVKKRIDLQDSIFRTEDAKFKAVVAKVEECHQRQQPVLVGTVSVEKSEKLSNMLTEKGIPHTVLNAKLHRKEAEIIAQAGKMGAVTIATNMAGRGTDILLGGNLSYLAKGEIRGQLCEYLSENNLDASETYIDHLLVEADGHADTDDKLVLMARGLYNKAIKEHESSVEREREKVRELGGLYVIGTERHESRRIDNQLRGRSGRQGDPGTSKFFLSFEDDLMRFFGGEKSKKMMTSLEPNSDASIESRLITSVIRNAQKKLETQHFNMRKQVLAYDDVLNQQREVIYQKRNAILAADDVNAIVMEMINETINKICHQKLPPKEKCNWDLASVRSYFMGWLCWNDEFNFTKEQLDMLCTDDVIKALQERATNVLNMKEKAYGVPSVENSKKIYILKNIDVAWMNHLNDMEHLKQGIKLRSYGQHNPIMEYRIEGASIFNSMLEGIKEQTAKAVLLDAATRN